MLHRRQAVYRRRQPSIADFSAGGDARVPARHRLDFPAWTEEYMAAWRRRSGSVLGAGADVRGYIDYVRSQSG